MEETKVERYYVQYDKMTNEWEVWEDNGKLCFPTFICSSGNKETCLMLRDALNSFPYTVEQYIATPEQAREDYL